MLGSFDNSFRNNGFAVPPGRLPSRAATATPKHERLTQVLDHEWSELPYAMMRLTAGRRPWDTNRVYWRDRTVQLGEIDLVLVKTRAQDQRPGYKAVYSLDELRREFTLSPSLNAKQLRWHAPGISDVKLSTDQLAEKLLSKLVTFYSVGLLSGTTTSSASPNLSS